MLKPAHGPDAVLPRSSSANREPTATSAATGAHELEQGVGLGRDVLAVGVDLDGDSGIPLVVGVPEAGAQRGADPEVERVAARP